MPTLISKQEIIMKCRVLGVHVNASLADLKHARDRLAKLYHPDKHMQESPAVRDKIQERFKIIQASYEYLKENHNAIQNEHKDLQDYILTSKESPMSRAHWVYNEVQSFN